LKRSEDFADVYVGDRGVRTDYFVLVVALVMWGATICWAARTQILRLRLGLPRTPALTGLVNSLLLILVLFLKPPGTVDLENPGGDESCGVLAGRFGKMAVQVAQLDRCHLILDADLAGHRLCGYESEEAAGEQSVRDCIQRVGRLCGLPRRWGVDFLLIH